jgi:hypothetical protein
MAALAVFAGSAVMGSPQKKLRGGEPLEQQQSSTATENDVAARRQHSSAAEDSPVTVSLASFSVLHTLERLDSFCKIRTA